MTLNEISVYLSLQPKLCHFYIDTWLNVDYTLMKGNVSLVVGIRVTADNVTVKASWRNEIVDGSSDYVSRTYKTIDMTEELLNKIIEVDMQELYNMAVEPYKKLLVQVKMNKMEGDF
jgi:hypothetical protein